MSRFAGSALEAFDWILLCWYLNYFANRPFSCCCVYTGQPRNYLSQQENMIGAVIRKLICTMYCIKFRLIKCEKHDFTNKGIFENRPSMSVYHSSALNALYCQWIFKLRIQASKSFLTFFMTWNNIVMLEKLQTFNLSWRCWGMGIWSIAWDGDIIFCLFDTWFKNIYHLNSMFSNGSLNWWLNTFI